MRNVIPQNVCYRCKGLKHYMGLGGMKSNCDCDAYKLANTPKISVDKRSKEFKKAVKEMKADNPNMTESKAVELLDAALSK